MHGLMTGRLLSPRLLAMMLERRALDVPLTGRPWKTAGYGLGVMMDIETALGRCFGHSGEGHGSVCAVYHFPDCDPPRTVAAFAPHENEGARRSRRRLMLRTAAAYLFVLSERYRSNASFGFMFWCTTAPTAAIIALGASDWKMLRPMSTPAAPCCTAL